MYLEHTYKEKMSDCLKSKRLAEREVNPKNKDLAVKRSKQKQKYIWEQRRLSKIISLRSN